MVNKKQTSKSVATKASKILRDGRSSKNTKSVAASALSQTKTSKKINFFISIYAPFFAFSRFLFNNWELI